MSDGMKRCHKCGMLLPIERFRHDRSRSDGYEYVCKTCKHEISGVHRSVGNKLQSTTEAIRILQNEYFITKKPRQQDYHFTPDISPLQGETYRIGVVSDTQLGSKYQQLTHLHSFYKYAKSRGVTSILHAGDLVDGQKMYKGHEYELFLHGFEAQLDYTIDNYPCVDGITTWFILGNHDESHYKLSGGDIGKHISRRRKDMRFLGYHGAYLDFAGVHNLIYLHHGKGGVAYARSYKLQKLIEQLAPEAKPFLLFDGHYHVACHLTGYRNVYGWQMPCFQSQTPYLRAGGLYPEVAGLIVEFTVRECRPVLFRSEVVPFHSPVEDDF